MDLPVLSDVGWELKQSFLTPFVIILTTRATDCPTVCINLYHILEYCMLVFPHCLWCWRSCLNDGLIISYLYLIKDPPPSSPYDYSLLLAALIKPIINSYSEFLIVKDDKITVWNHSFLQSSMISLI